MGMETPSTETARAMESIQLSFLIAAAMPSGRATATANNIAYVTSSKVAGKR